MKTSNKAKYAALLSATILLTINFWAWSLISPLATTYANQLNLSPLTLSVLVAAPVVIGSLGRIPVGMLADRYGGRRTLTAVCWLAAAVVAWLSLTDSSTELMAAAFALGVAGTAFAAGVPFVNAWFPKNQRGLALGIYAMGNAGTAISGLLTPNLVQAMGQAHLFWLVACLLILAGAMMSIFGQDGPDWRPAKSSALVRLKKAFSWKLTSRLSLLYALTFGAFVTLGLYLPILLNKSYDLTVVDAAARAAGFVLVATAIRPLGGWLSDQLSGLTVLRLAFLAMFVLAGAAATQPPLAPIGTLVYLGLAAALGIGNGAVLAIVGHRCDARLVGTVTGLIGAAGGIGGYFPPLVMGLSFQLFNSYAAALLLFATTCLIIFWKLKKLLGITAKY